MCCLVKITQKNKLQLCCGDRSIPNNYNDDDESIDHDAEPCCKFKCNKKGMLGLLIENSGTYNCGEWMTETFSQDRHRKACDNTPVEPEFGPSSDEDSDDDEDESQDETENARDDEQVSSVDERLSENEDV